VIGEVNDPLEYEADRIAEQVTADSPQPASVPRLTAATVSVPLQRACSGGGIGAGCKREEDEEKLQQKAAPGSAALQAVTGVPPIVNEVLHTSGKPMSHVIRTFFEPRFRHDFSHVRIHTDARAAESAKQMRAHAYTVGPHIVFARDRFAPSGAPGQKLLAHELTHVLQQEKEPSIARLQREDVPNDPYPGTEDGEQPGLFSLSDEGFAFLKGHEGCRLALYNDSAGHCTIGFGHLVHHGKCNGNEPENFKSGISEDDASDLFSADLEKYEAAVSSNVTSRLNQAFYDALVSFTFNIGIGGFRGSGVLRQINQKNYSKVPEEMMKWNTPTEIEGRRTDEANLFRTGNYSYPPVKCT
jgi:GH24 family phage-related lysozyme (muramidase)